MKNEKTKQQQNIGEVILQWEMPEYAHYDKGKTWYLIAGVIVLALIVYGLFMAEYTMVLAFALLAGVYYVLHNETPKNITIIITTHGLVIDKDFYQFSDIDHFWIVHKPHSNLKVLYLRALKKMSTDVRIELMEQDPMLVRQLLQTQIKEESGTDETFVDKVSRWLKL